MKKPPAILLSLPEPQTAVQAIHQRLPEADVRVGPYLDDVGQEMPEALMRSVGVLLCEMVPENVDVFDELRWIQLTSSGYGHITHLPILDRGITVTNGRGNFDVAIAEWNLMMMLFWRRRMHEQFRNQQRKVWDRAARFQNRLRGLTVGFYGYGGLARETARLAKALNMTVWALTRHGVTSERREVFCEPNAGDPTGTLPDRVFSADADEAFFRGVDFLILAMPLNKQTEGSIAEREMRMLKRSAVLINPARAQLIPQDVFLLALTERWIEGASLDVHYAYPLPEDSPLWTLDNLIITPHVSGHSATEAFMNNVMSIFTDNLERFVDGRPLINRLTDDQIAGRA